MIAFIYLFVYSFIDLFIYFFHLIIHLFIKLILIACPTYFLAGECQSNLVDIL